MDSAPASPVPPSDPAQSPIIPRDLIDIDDEDSDASEPQDARYSVRSLRAPSLCKLLEMQRVLHKAVVSDSTEAKDKASCARAWRDLEVLRYAKKGRPLALNAQAKVEVRPSSKQPAAISVLADEAAA